MRNLSIYSLALLAGSLLLPAATAGATGYYGFAPNDCPQEEISAVGTGSNAFMEAAILLDPSADALRPTIMLVHASGAAVRASAGVHAATPASAAIATETIALINIA